MSSSSDPHGSSQPGGSPGPSFEPASQSPSPWAPQGDPYVQPSADPYGQPQEGHYAQPSVDPYAQPQGGPYASASAQPHAQPSVDPYAYPSSTPHSQTAQGHHAQPSADLYPEPAGPHHQPSASPYGQPGAGWYGQPGADRYGQVAPGPGQQAGAQPPNLYGTPNPYGPGGGNDIYGVYQYQGPAKSKSTAALLAFFLGSFGAHNFYLRQSKRGWLHVALGPLTWLCMVLFGVLAVNNPAGEDVWFGLVGLLYLMTTINGIWAFIEFIIILTKPEHELGR